MGGVKPSVVVLDDVDTTLVSELVVASGLVVNVIFVDDSASSVKFVLMSVTVKPVATVMEDVFVPVKVVVVSETPVLVNELQLLVVLLRSAVIVLFSD